ncbi:MAG: SRPBCC domain-containing protein [Nocardioides sp.]|nr:SRPBCC domain-containing protein [Nocardioides sp.]
MPADIVPEVGHRFHLQMPKWGPQPGEVLEVKEPELFVHTFGDWTLTWRLRAEGKGTRLILGHAGFDLENPQHRFALDNMGPGWRDVVLPRLAQVLESSAE